MRKLLLGCVAACAAASAFAQAPAYEAVGDAQAQLRGREAGARARKRGRDVAEAIFTGNLMAERATSLIAIHHDASTARRVAGFCPERPRNRIPDCLEALRRRVPRGAREKHAGQQSSHYASVSPWFLSGSERIRLPVAAKIALHTAGAIDAWPGSPTPPQKPPVGAITISTLGISRRRIIR